MSRRACAVATLLLLSAATHAAGRQVFAGDEQENYLRYLQTIGLVPLYPWGMRAFSPAEGDQLTPRDTSHPWHALRDFAEPSGRRPFTVIAPTLTARINTTFPFGYNDGPVWAGKGLTFAAQGGLAGRWGPVSVTIAPLAFVAQNAGFRLQPNGASGAQAYGDGYWSGAIDRPQRFGDAVYTRLDAGQSTLRLDWRGLAIGLTTANQYWGPASELPVILGNNAPGFPHMFLGTSRPVDLWLMRIHARLIWGRLAQSAFSAETTAAGRRFGAGIVLDFSSRWVPGLEIGATRFSHEPWPAGGLTWDHWATMFHGGQGTQKNLGDVNQLASVFFRWVLPSSGFEVYGEYGRDDYNLDIRDFVLEPDHIGGYTLGFRKVLRRADTRFLAVRAELQNLQFSRLAEGRQWEPFYSHGGVQQGHTQLGQVLGSEAAVGGAGSVVAVESFAPHGRWTWSWTRMLRQQRGDVTGVAPDPDGVDVQHALAVERLQFHRRYDIFGRVTVVYELNRNFAADAFNLNVVVGTRLNVR